MPKIKCENLSVTYIDKNKNEYPALNNLNATFDNGLISVILGENGSGKSTLLKAISLCFKFDGHIYFDDQDIEQKSISDLNISYVDQNFALYPHLLVYDNIAYPLYVKKMDSDEIDRRVKKIASELGLSLLLTRKPKELSIGQQQRVAIARALVKKPEVILLDEIMSNLDVQTQKNTRKVIKNLIKSYNVTCLYVTHSQEDALEMADKIYHMKDGKIVNE